MHVNRLAWPFANNSIPYECMLNMALLNLPCEQLRTSEKAERVGLVHLYLKWSALLHWLQLQLARSRRHQGLGEPDWAFFKVYLSVGAPSIFLRIMGGDTTVPTL